MARRPRTNDAKKAAMLRARAATQKRGCCDEWEGPFDGRGYPRFRYAGRDRPVARVLWELVRGPIPAGYHLDHVLRNISADACTLRCISLFHLEPVPAAVNILRGRGASAINARKTHCDRGHPFTADNTNLKWNGGRECRECKRQSDRACYDRRFEREHFGWAV
jgi:hypothetical protein